MLRFAMGVTRKDNITNEYIKDTVKVERLEMKMREERLRWWTYHKKRPRVCRKKGEGNKVTRKRKRVRPKRRFLDVVKDDMRKVGAREKDIENRTLWQPLIEGKGRKKKKSAEWSSGYRRRACD